VVLGLGGADGLAVYLFVGDVDAVGAGDGCVGGVNLCGDNLSEFYWGHDFFLSFKV